MNKNTISFFVGLGVLVAMCAGVYVGVQRLAAPAPAQQDVGGAGFSLAQAFYLSAASSGVSQQAGAVEATTSVQYLPAAGTASSTILTYTNRAVGFDLNLNATASSSATKYVWTNWFSWNGVDYFCEDGNSVDSTVSNTHGAGCLYHYWTPGVTATTSKNVSLPATQAPYSKTIISASAAAGAIWAQAIPKDVVPN